MRHNSIVNFGVADFPQSVAAGLARRLRHKGRHNCLKVPEGFTFRRTVGCTEVISISAMESEGLTWKNHNWVHLVHLGQLLGSGEQRNQGIRMNQSMKMHEMKHVSFSIFPSVSYFSIFFLALFLGFKATLKKVEKAAPDASDVRNLVWHRHQSSQQVNL